MLPAADPLALGRSCVLSVAILALTACASTDAPPDAVAGGEAGVGGGGADDREAPDGPDGPDAPDGPEDQDDEPGRAGDGPAGGGEVAPDPGDPGDIDGGDAPDPSATGEACSECSVDGDCMPGSTCVTLDGGSYCLGACDASSCDGGYTCRRTGDDDDQRCVPRFGGCCFTGGKPGPGAAEQCNGLDDDCDGETDESFPELGAACDGPGDSDVCLDGAVVCSPNGRGVSCADEEDLDHVEICDGLDNDCNGRVDDGFEVGARCTFGEGVCETQGQLVCSEDGSGVVCDARADEDPNTCVTDGSCMAAGTRHPERCAVCAPAFDRFDWTDSCRVQVTGDSHDELVAGRREAGGADLHITADGRIAPIHMLDMNRDGWSDLFFNNHEWDGTFEIDSYLYWGGLEGFDEDRRRDLPGAGSYGHVVADVNMDGWPDLVTTNHRTDDGFEAYLEVWWGGAGGYVPEHRARLPTMGGAGVSVADMDRDGHLDIIVSNYTDGVGYDVDSYIYWGAPLGFHPAIRAALPTFGSRSHRVADLNRDGRLDVVFANEQAGGMFEARSMIYYGGEAPRSDFRPVAVRTLGAADVEVADLNGDRWPDLVFANHRDDDGFRIDSFVYLGGPDGFADEPDEALATRGAASVSIADLNRDGWLDLFFANFFDDDDNSVDSRIYWGDGGTYDEDDDRNLRTRGASGSLLLDADHDGDWDIVVPQLFNDPDPQDETYLFIGRDDDFSERRKENLPTLGAAFGVGRDPVGATGDRERSYRFVSGIWDCGASSFAGRLSWLGETPEHTALRLRVRSAATREAIEDAPWIGPDGVEDGWFEQSPAAMPPELDGGRFWQVLVQFDRDRPVWGPVLDSLTLAVAPVDAP